MIIKITEKTPEKLSFISNMNVNLANAIRRSVEEIDILAIEEVDFYKNDSALYDEIIAHRLGLISLKNQKLKKDQKIEMTLKVKGKEKLMEVRANELGSEVVYPETPLVFLGEGQSLELVAKAKVGKGKNHSKFSPGVIFYKHLPKIKISKDGEKQIEIVEIYPETFEVYGKKLSIKNAGSGDLDYEDLKNYPGISIGFDDSLIFSIESWGQIEAKDVFTEACKALKDDLSKVSKVIK
tara:strand:- start:17285 stop:17998 length:714 start_codon:yes stop_codon:yes gene_type:complete